MLQILSSLTLGTRLDFKASAWVLANAKTGTFVSLTADGIGQPAAGAFALPIWSESNRDGSAGFSPDIAATGNITVFYGKLYGITDQFAGTPAIGDALYVNTAGKLCTTGGSGFVPVAYCTKAAHTVPYLGSNFTSIGFVLA